MSPAKCLSCLGFTMLTHWGRDQIDAMSQTNENVWISHRISLKFVPKVRINNIPALVQIMAWRRPGDKPLSEPMMVSLLTHICVTRRQWVNSLQALLLSAKRNGMPLKPNDVDSCKRTLEFRLPNCHYSLMICRYVLICLLDNSDRQDPKSYFTF